MQIYPIKCSRCKNNAPVGHKMCEYCREKANAYAIKSYSHRKESIRDLGVVSVESGLCKSCRKLPIYAEHSATYCKHCYSTRQKGNIKSRKLHWIPPLPRIVMTLEEKKLSDKRYRDSHKEEAKKNSLEWVKNNKDRFRKTQKAWQENNRDKCSAYVKKYNLLHPEQVTKSSRMRRELFKSIEGTFTLTEWNNLCQSVGNRCLWCGKSGIKLTIDHVVPITKKGTNYIDNLQPLCASCNSKKGNKTIDFRPFGSVIMEWT
jgi:5-methylcytosine-specific restriction endonuclease McrA